MRELKIIFLVFLVVLVIPVKLIKPYDKTITCSVFDRYTGDYYLGATGISADATHYVAKIARTFDSFTGLSTRAATQIDIALLTLLNSTGAGATHAIVRPTAALNQIKTIDLSDLTNVTLDLPQAGLDISDAAGVAATGITKIAGAKDKLFLRTYPVGGDGTQNSGIKGFKLNAGVWGHIQCVQGGVVVDNAIALDNQRGGLVGGIGDGKFLRNGSASAAYVAAPIVNDIYYDKDLDTLFICASLTTIVAADFNMAISKLKINAVTGQMALSDLLPAGVNPAQDNTATIFASANNLNSNDTRILKIRTMHTSTDKWYLIINGDIGATNDAVANKIYALRYDINTGFVIQNNTAGSALANNFARTGLLNNSLDGGYNNSLTVGGANYLLQATAANQVSDMHVVGDTVYVSVSGNKSNTVDPGIYASTAMFDNNGVIIAWTEWEKVYLAQNDNLLDSPYSFDVDAQAGQLCKVRGGAGASPTYVTRTNITVSGFAAGSLAGQLNTDLNTGCFCALNLPAHTPGLNGEDSTGVVANYSLNSLSLFGGYEKIIFTRNTGPEDHTVFFNVYNTNPVYLSTTLSEAGAVRALGYSCATNVNVAGVKNQGYFFAGTDLGLWAFADANLRIGFNNNTNIAPYGISHLDTSAGRATTSAIQNFSWQKFLSSKITGAVVAIEATGTYLYVVELNNSNINNIVSRLWRVQIDNSLDLMSQDDHITIIAQSGSNNIPTNSLFTGFKFITDLNGANWVGILSTTNGLFESSVSLNIFNPAADTWNKIGTNIGVADNSNAIYNAIYSPKAYLVTGGRNCKIYGITQVDDAWNKNYYQNGKIKGVGFDLMFTPNVADYTNGNMVTGFALPYVDRLVNFWTDGARRLYSRYQVSEYDSPTTFNPVRSLPYRGAEWNMSEEIEFDELTGLPKIYWIENISGLGIILAGTDNGVIALSN